MNIYLICVIVLALMLVRVPVYLSIGAGCALYFVTHDMRIATLAMRSALSIDSFPLIAIPLFMLAGRLMNTTGITERIFRFCHSLVGFIPGGLGHVNIVGSLVFAGMSGSALADLGGLGQIEIKAMRNAGYPARFSIGVTTVSSILGPIIPPSIAAIIYAISAQVSVAALFLAGILPGLVIAGFQMLFVFAYAVRQDLPREPVPTVRRLAGDFVLAFPAIITPVLLIGGMTAGVFSPTEAAAVAVLYSLLLGMGVYRELRPRELVQVCVTVGREVATLMIIVAMGIVFGWILTLERVPQDVAALILEYSDSPNLVILILIGAVLFLGCFMEVTVLLLLLPPIIVPSLVQIGFDPLHLGIVMIVSMMIGMFTPPFGVGLFAMQQIAQVSFGQVVRSVLPWLIPLFAALLVITYVPQIVLALPRAAGF